MVIAADIFRGKAGITEKEFKNHYFMKLMQKAI